MKLIENEKLMSEWNYDKNKGLNIEDFTMGSNKIVWWNCPDCGSEYDMDINRRNRGSNCPYCAGKRVNHTNSLASLRPDLLKYWDYNKNKKSPHDYALKSGKKVWLICDKGHGYSQEIRSFTKGSQCPYCIGHKVCEDNCLATINPELSKEWNHEKNGSLTPHDVTSNSNKKVWWKCGKCNSEWKTSVGNRNYSEQGCPYCTGQRVNDTNSFASICPDLITYWDYNKNKKSPNEYTSASGVKVWWVCDNGHNFKTEIANMTYGYKCPVCNSLGHLYPELIKEWHPTKNGKLTPYDIAGSSGRKIWWQCENGHEWDTAVNHRTGKLKSGCPYCKGKKADLKNNLLAINPTLASEWYYELNDSIPNEHLPFSNKKVWWECKECKNIWKSNISDRSLGSGCPICNETKGEKRVRKWLEENKLIFTAQMEFKGLIGIGGGNLSYDFYLPNQNLLIEYQGVFHDGSGGEYTQINLETQQEHDKRKREYAKLHNINLLEIWYYDYENIEKILENKFKSFSCNR